MMPLSADMAAVAKRLAWDWEHYLCGIKGMAGFKPCRTYWCIPDYYARLFGFCIMFSQPWFGELSMRVLSLVVTEHTKSRRPGAWPGTSCNSRKTNWNTRQWSEIPKPPIFGIRRRVWQEVGRMPLVALRHRHDGGVCIWTGHLSNRKIKGWFLQSTGKLLFQAAALVIDTIRTFFLIVLPFWDQLPLLFPYGTDFSLRSRNGSTTVYQCAFTPAYLFRICSVLCWQKYNRWYWKGI